MATKDYDPRLSQAGFMDLVGAIETLLKTDASLKSLESDAGGAARCGHAAWRRSGALPFNR